MGCSGRDGWYPSVICGHGRVPFSEGLRQGAIEGLGAGLQEQVGTGLGPLHLLLLGKALADHEVDSGFREGCRDRLRVAPALAVVRDRGRVVVDVGDQACRRFGEPRQAEIVAVQDGAEGPSARKSTLAYWMQY